MSIDLAKQRATDNLSFYEDGHIFGVMYNSKSLPSEDKLQNDLSAMLKLYQQSIIVGGASDPESEDADCDPERDSAEGQTLIEKKRYRIHKRLDRNPKVAQKVKEVQGCICKVCGFDFSQKYGDHGAGYIEAHHLAPLHTLPLDKQVSRDPQKDFIVLCSNCHRMIHRTKDILSPEQLKRLLM